MLANLAAALLGEHFKWSSWVLYTLLTLTVLLTIAAAILYLGSARGIRSVHAEGFNRNRDAIFYGLFWKGVRPSAIFLAWATFAVSLFTGWTDTLSGLLAFLTAPLAMIYGAATTKYPADRSGGV